MKVVGSSFSSPGASRKVGDASSNTGDGDVAPKGVTRKKTSPFAPGEM